MDHRVLSTWFMVVLVTFCGCQQLHVNNLAQRIAPSNSRNWSPQFSKLPYAVGQADGTIQIFNIRNNQYLSENDFVPQYYDRAVRLGDIQTVDFIVCPFQEHEYMAHTMLSFGFSDGTYLTISAEIRTEKGEEYSPFWGLNRQYELAYVVADERDVIRLRTHHRNADVYIYRTVSNPQQSQALFVDMMERTNKLAQQPEFYNTIRNNCTTNILSHVNRLKEQKLLYNWKVFLPGYSAEYAYEEGLLDNSVPFAQLKQESWINDLSRQFYDDPEYSAKIRRGIRIPQPNMNRPTNGGQRPVQTAVDNLRNWFIGTTRSR